MTAADGPSRDCRVLADDLFAAMMRATPFAATEFGVPGHDAEVPDVSAEAEAHQAVAFTELRGRADAIDPTTLDEQDRITLALARHEADVHASRARSGALEHSASPTVMGVHVAVLGIVGKVVLDTSAQRADYVARCGRLDSFLDGASERLRDGILRGRTPPARGVVGAVEQIDAYLATPVAQDPLLAAVSDAVTREAVAAAVRDVVRPAMGRYRETLAAVVPHARADGRSGVCWLPDGQARYAEEVRHHTTTTLTPEAIHQVGLDVVAELEEEYRDLGERVFGSRDVAEAMRRLRTDPALRFRRAEEILASARGALDRVDQVVPEWFGRRPVAPCVVRPMSPQEAKDSVLGYYQAPAADGSRPGTHWVNTHEPTTRLRYEYEALAFHESVPGHHLQFALAQELTDLPDLRRFAYVTAFGEGWALYTERLGDEMGLYTSDLERFGMLAFDSWRACRLVVDTGIHQMGWSRDAALAYMTANSPLSPENVANEVDRYIAAPGQALAYMIGRREITRLRDHARRTLGGRFDIRTFHDTVLGNGSIPLHVLADAVDQWVDRGGGDLGRAVHQPQHDQPDATRMPPR